MTGPLKPPGSAIRALVVYEHALLRDIAMRVLSNAGVEVVAAISSDSLNMADVRSLQPDVVVVDRAAEHFVESLCRDRLFGQEPRPAARVVVIGLTESTMVIYCRRLIVDATADNLVEAVLGLPLAARDSSTGPV